MRKPSTRARLIERDAPQDEDAFAHAVIEGLSQPRKTLPCRYFYDERGSQLFEEITRLPEYYPTRTEAAILEAYAGEMADAVPRGAALIEFGSGSSLKTEILLKHLAGLGCYVSIDVSQSALEEAAGRLARRFPTLDVRPIVGDFTNPIALPADVAARPKTGFFPGSTIGNFALAEAQRVLGVFRAMLAPGGRLIVGADLKKDARTLVLAYNDAAGVTAAFNLNLLARINRELSGTFDLAAFRHEAVYNPREGRIEMHLLATRAQEVAVRGRRFRFREGESIHTENSYKYSIDQFRDFARSAGWEPQRVWTDPNALFSVHELASLPSPAHR